MDDGSCTYDVYGCTDPYANNYNPSATIDDGSCTYYVSGCTDPIASNYNPYAVIDDGSCSYGSGNVSISLSWNDGRDADTCVSYNGVTGGWSCGGGNGWGGDNTSGGGNEYYNFTGTSGDSVTICATWYGQVGSGLSVVVQQTGFSNVTFFLSPSFAQGCACDVGVCQTITLQ